MIRRRQFAVHDHVQLVCDHSMADCTVPAGETGVIIDVDPDDANAIVVSLDNDIASLRYRRNLICVTTADVERIGG